MFDIVVAMRMRSNDALMFPETAENSGEQRARPLFWVFAERRRPRIPAANAVSLADNLPQQQQKQQRCLGHHTARCLSASFEMICALGDPARCKEAQSAMQA